MNKKLLDIINKVRANSGLESVSLIEIEMNLKRDLELDSISIAELIAEIDLAFNIDVNAKGMIETIGDIQERL